MGDEVSGSEDLKSYFFVLSEEKDCSELERGLLDAFGRFAKAHINDSEVVFLTPDDEKFGKARSIFGISQTPAFVVADEPNKLETEANPFISFNRPAIEKFPGEGIFNLITDIHYLLIDENILRVKEGLTVTWLLKTFRGFWSELKDFVSVNVKTN